MKKTNLIVAGSGRSGTTWVLDVIAKAAKMRTVFEPLHPEASQLSSVYAGRYMPADKEDDVLSGFIASMLSGRFNSIWSNYRVISSRLVPTWHTFFKPRAMLEILERYKSLYENYSEFSYESGSPVVVKFIRANLMLEWIVKNHQVKLLFVLRHPCAVIESKIRLDAAASKAGLQHGVSDWEPSSVLSQYTNDRAFYNDFIQKYADRLDIENLNELETHAVNWCFENVPVLKIAEKENISLVCYENLVANGRSEWLSICNDLGIEIDENSLKIDAPSQQASDDFKCLKSVESRLSRWEDRFTDIDKKKINNILEVFGLSIYDANKVMPNKSVFFNDNERVR